MTKFNYEIFFRFIDKYKAQGFQDIDPQDDLMIELEEKLISSGQIFHVADYSRVKLLYLCERCHEYFGVQPEQMDPSVYLESTHPDDMKRHALGRSIVFKMGSEMFQDKSDVWYLSTHFKTKTASGKYIDLLYQMCLIYSEFPEKTVYGIQVNTDVSGLLADKHGYHYYVGHDKSFFRYPDKELLMIGNVFSKREFEIIKGIARGLGSQEIAEELFLSVHTVNTHRRNILQKTNKRNTHELVHELKERGVI